MDFVGLAQHVTQLKLAGRTTDVDVENAVRFAGLETFAQLNARPDLVRVVLSAINATAKPAQ